MAGNYPDAPGPRMAWDRDGSVGFRHDNATVTQLTATEIRNLNSENRLNVSIFTGYGGVVFPQLRDIIGIFLAGPGDSDTVQTSVDTTNGLDGTWTTRLSGVADITEVIPNYRTVLSCVATAVKSIRFSHGGAADMKAFHIYGNISAGQTPDRLRIWHPTLDQEIGGAYFDWGNVPRGSSADRQIRIKNNSATLTANTITVSIEATTGGTPSIAAQHVFSTDGTNFASTASIASLAPGAISSAITVRRITPTNAELSVWTARIIADALTWV